MNYFGNLLEIMKLKPGTRTRLNGYLAIAVTTLLTPGGKLISSAVAAATVVGVVAMNTPKQDENVGSSSPTIQTAGSPENSILNVSGLTGGTEPDMLTPDALGTDQNTAQKVSNEIKPFQAVITAPSENRVALSYTMSASSGGFGAPSPPIFNPISGPESGPATSEPSILPPDDASKPDLGELPPPKDLLASPDIADAPIHGPVTNELPVAGDVPPSTEEGFPAPGEIFPPEVIAKFAPMSLAASPLDAVLPLDAAAIPEPSTLAMVLLGLTGLGRIYRRKQDQAESE